MPETRGVLSALQEIRILSLAGAHTPARTRFSKKDQKP
jgi:hypothetical protein